MDRDEQLEFFFESVRQAASSIKALVKKDLFIRVHCHHDADGVAAGGIIGSTLSRLGAKFRIRVEKQIDESLARDLASEGSWPCIFTDLGGGYLNLIGEHLEGIETIILDHHEPLGSPFKGLIHANPHLSGLDGAREVSGSGVAYFVAKSLDSKNVDLSSVAIVGALGDLQDKNEERELRGLNALIVTDGVEADVLKVDKDLLLFGRETRQIHRALSLTTNPFIPGLSGREDKCLGFLVNLGFKLQDGDRWRTLAELNKEEKQLLFSKLAEYMIKNGLPSSSPLELIGKVYTLIQEDKSTFFRDGREFSSLLNACARTKKTGLALALCMGDRKVAVVEAESAVNEYRRTLAEYLDWATGDQGHVEETASCHVLRGEGVIDERMIGSVSSILVTSGMVDASKPLLSLAQTEEGMIKVSARASNTLLEKGLNLGNIMQRAAESVGGRGGGHDVAAGALLPIGSEDAFLSEARRLIEETLI